MRTLARKHPKFGMFRGRKARCRDAVDWKNMMRSLNVYQEERAILNPVKKKEAKS